MYVITDRHLDTLDTGALNGTLDDIIDPMAIIVGAATFTLSLIFFAARWDRRSLGRRARR